MMKVFSMFSAAALLSKAIAVPVDQNGEVHPLEGYEIVVPEWEVEVKPGGEKAILNGTIEEVHEKLLQLNPNWDEDFPDAESTVDERSLNDFSYNPDLTKRTDFSGAKYNCFGRWGAADYNTILRGIDYLRRVSGKPNYGAGPSTCGRVSCSYNAAIYWCNDDDKPKTLNSFGSIADGAEYIRLHCRRPNPFGYHKTAGQVFHKTHWNVIVQSDSC